MNYTCCEEIMWHLMSPGSLRFLSKQGWEVPALRKKAKTIYREMVARTPSIGGPGGNSLHVCLAAGMVWLSIYEAAGRMDDACFGAMVEAGMARPMIKAFYTGKAKDAFTLETQRKRAANAVRDNAAPGGAFNWQAEVILGRDAEEYTILYHRCGLCALGSQEGLPQLVKYLCALDTMPISWMGGALYRTKTLAAGGDCCNFYICKKNSKWDKKQGEGELQC